MQPIEINVHVQLGVSPELSALLTPLLSHVSAATLAPAAEEQPAPTPAPKPTKGKAKKETAKEEPAAPVEEPAQEEAPAAEEQPEPAKEEQPADENWNDKEYTEADVREAMDRTRKRIEGEDYKEHTDSEGYQAWHRKLTGWFKNTAAVFGAEKPSALPDSNARYMFIQKCELVEIINGELGIKAPF